MMISPKEIDAIGQPLYEEFIEKIRNIAREKQLNYPDQLRVLFEVAKRVTYAVILTAYNAIGQEPNATVDDDIELNHFSIFEGYFDAFIGENLPDSDDKRRISVPSEEFSKSIALISSIAMHHIAKETSKIELIGAHMFSLILSIKTSLLGTSIYDVISSNKRFSDLSEEQKTERAQCFSKDLAKLIDEYIGNY
jgi:hypothetical protein